MPRKTLYIYLFLVGLYVGLALFTPASARVLEKYDVTQAQARLLNLSIVIPSIGIWFAAFYGYGRFKRYAEKIHDSKEGPAFTSIANGLGLLALSLPVVAILNAAFRYPVSQSPDLMPVTTIIVNYVTLLFALAAFVFIYKGSKQLVEFVTTVKQHRLMPFLVTVFGILSVIYAYVALSNPYRMEAFGNIEKATYYLPDPLILVTIVMPYLFIWFIGLRAIANIVAYKNNVGGVVYEKLFTYLVRGIAGVIAVSILLQLFRDTSSVLSSLSLGALMLVVYLLLAAMAVSYIYIAAGAKRLHKIEEV